MKAYKIQLNILMLSIGQRFDKWDIRKPFAAQNPVNEQRLRFTASKAVNCDTTST